MFNDFNMVTFIIEKLILLLVVFTALPLHEYAHGFVANKLGDPTARMQGRLNLNPFTHLDLIGTLALLFVGFGWAKPVPVNPRYFKNPKRDMALTALAGPVSNILLATALTILWKLFSYFINISPSVDNMIFVLFQTMVMTNIGLAVFNLIPVPPLDGSKIMALFLPDRIMNTFYQYERYITLGLFAVIMFTPILNYPINIARDFLFKGIDFVTGFMEIIANVLL